MSRLGAIHLTKYTGVKHSATVFYFHGSGGSGDNMKEWVRLMSDFTFPHINIVYPTAPAQSYTPAGGLLSNVWFDRADISIEVPEKLDSISEIEKEVRYLIQKENEASIPCNRIVVGGFSMGGCLALHTAYRWVRDVAGVFAFSSFLNDNSIVYEDLKNAGINGMYKIIK
ncbi:unnamed protein product [Diatraea saccharalis]|uniref:palmitoyl-protein hydrolase n=1 Tax=Diatraea saccharalis TaxID=40085 RepID=A0A9P0C680_9NEOP|nr:unnamed protein product [Diatraea saccharalis]